MIGTTLKHFLYDLALNIFFDAVSNNFHTGVNLIGKRAILTHLQNDRKYAIIITEVNTMLNSDGTTDPSVAGTLEDAWGVPDEEYVEDLGCSFTFDLEYFNMVVL
jgi:hypothetical protein